MVFMMNCVRESDLTLAKAIDMCRAKEISTKELKTLNSSKEQTVLVIECHVVIVDENT